MVKIDTLDILKSCTSEENIFENEPMTNHTSFRTGGAAKYFVTPSSCEEVVKLVNSLKNNSKNYIVIGNGSNLLVSDHGFNGIVISIGKKMSDITVEGTTITAMAGAFLSRIAYAAQKNSLSGFEFASGIPGFLGGAIVMNAGAYGGEMKDVVRETTYLSSDGTVKVCKGEEHGFAYRKSRFTKDDIILSAVIELVKGNPEEIKARSDELNMQRKEKQPLDYPSAGSTFKRPEGYFAAKLIDDAGLRGYAVGGAMVSEKHCGFVINYNNATSTDVFNLMKDIKRIVHEKFGVTLEPEVRFVGEFPEF